MKVRALAACLAIGTICGCGAVAGIRDEGDQRAFDELGSSPTPQSIGVYFLTFGDVAEVGRRVPGTQPAKEALLQLLAGPTPTEANRFGSAIPAGVRLQSFRIDIDGTAYVQLRGDFTDIIDTQSENGAKGRQRQLLLKQIVYTLTRFTPVQQVEVSLNGEPVPLTQGLRGPVLTKALFAQSALAPVDETGCGDLDPPVRAGKDLRLLEPKADAVVPDQLVTYAGETVAKSGLISVRLIKDGRTIRSPDEKQAAYNQPAAGGTEPCARFHGQVEVPWGVTGAMTLRVELAPGPGGAGEATVIERPITLTPGGGATDAR